MQVQHLVELVKRRVVHVIVTIDIILIATPLIIILLRVNVDVGVFLVLNNDRFSVILHISLLSLLLRLQCLETNLDAPLAQVGQGLDDVGVICLHAIGHLTVHKEGCQSQHEPLHLEVFLHKRDFLEDRLEELPHGALLLKHSHRLAQVVPEAHEQALQQHDLEFGSFGPLQLVEL